MGLNGIFEDLNPIRFIMCQGETSLHRNFYVLFDVLYREQEEDGSASA